MLSNMMILLPIIASFASHIAQLDAAICTLPASKKSTTVEKTITVTQSIDYQYTTLVGGSGILNGACAVNNGKLKYLLVLKNGVTVKNVILDTPGLGIYCEGNCVLENVYYKKLCYHATGFGYTNTGTSYTYQVIGGAGQGSPDKYFTQSGRGTTIIKNFCAEDLFLKENMANCGVHAVTVGTRCSEACRFPTLKGPGLAIVSVNQNYGDKVSFSGLTLYGQKSSSTATSYACQAYKGLTIMAAMSPTCNYRPTQSGSGSCSYSSSAIKIAD